MAIKLSKHKDAIDIDMTMDLDGDLPVVVSVTGKGITVRVKGQRIKQLSGLWPQLLSKLSIPNNAPGKYLGRSIDFMHGR